MDSVIITLTNGDHLSVGFKTKVYAWKSDNATEEAGFYATSICAESRFDGDLLSTSDGRVGLQGLLGIADWFSLDPAGPLYRTSAILSIS
ncbi:hypothetical protein [Liquorilactobacillus nagelii]|jgi:5-keto 4-deoxyuronate isomerase|uniref:hypothetical protein n=1 Tax=Liquorilactobacillus nagelii TaxID=82688 RepID=UPI00242B805D|nr:hypothetical protein [Liquorilactobacillus nagelii]MCI1699437.1 hypothetical protein [Liquorilactobacillus nagelii]